MPPASREKHSETRLEKFRKAAEEADADKDEAAFKKRLEKIAAGKTAGKKPSNVD